MSLMKLCVCVPKIFNRLFQSHSPTTTKNGGDDEKDHNSLLYTVYIYRVLFSDTSDLTLYQTSLHITKVRDYSYPDFFCHILHTTR
jgi:hypothetical protein